MTQENKRLLVTGGSNGIGQAIAERGREDGFDVIVLDREGDDVVKCDLSDPESTKAALETVLRDGPVLRLVNNVGAVFPNTLDNQTLDEFDAAIALNLRAAFQCAQALAPGMKEAQFGRIVNISSRAAEGKESRSAYAATKAGLLGMTKTWALELGPSNITVNAIAPGPIATELFKNANPEDSPATQRILDAVPLGRMGTPEEVAHSVSHFLDTRTGFVTGQTLFVCGGITVGGSRG